MSINALIIASLSGAGGITYASIAWSHDQLITAHGWIVVACTTACVIGVFLGVEGLGRAQDRETRAQDREMLAKLLKAFLAGHRQHRFYGVDGQIADEVSEFLASRDDTDLG